MKQCGKQNLENISGILYNLVITSMLRFSSSKKEEKREEEKRGE
jgi:hypothetical protein